MAKRAKRKAKKSKTDATKIRKNIGYWIFLVGVLIAILAGIANTRTNPTIIGVLAILGLIVGLINVTLKEEVPFLIASVVLIIASTSLQAIPYIGNLLTAILMYIVVFVSPAAIVVALKAVYHFGK